LKENAQFGCASTAWHASSDDARLSLAAGARHSDGSPLELRPHDCRRVFASEYINAHTPVHVIQALLGRATINSVMIYAKLYDLLRGFDLRRDGLDPDGGGRHLGTRNEWGQ
jgi:integrase